MVTPLVFADFSSLDPLSMKITELYQLLDNISSIRFELTSRFLVSIDESEEQPDISPAASPVLSPPHPKKALPRKNQKLSSAAPSRSPSHTASTSPRPGQTSPQPDRQRNGSDQLHHSPLLPSRSPSYHAMTPPRQLKPAPPPSRQNGASAEPDSQNNLEEIGMPLITRSQTHF